MTRKRTQPPTEAATSGSAKKSGDREPVYEDGRVRKLARELAAAGVAPKIVERILEGGALVRKATTPRKKADWMREAMRRMDALLDRETRCAVREGCACCLGGKRLELVQAIARKGGTLEERVRAANATPLVFGRGVTLEEDGQLRVRFWPEGLPSYRCVCLPAATEPISETYCYCCGGHVRHHLQVALGVRLESKVDSSALASGGKRPCSFLFRVME